MTVCMLNSASGWPCKGTFSFFHFLWRGLITMFCRGAIEVLFNLKAAERLRWGRRGKQACKINLFSRVLWDLWSNLGSHWTLIWNHINLDFIPFPILCPLHYHILRKNELISLQFHNTSLLHHCVAQSARCSLTMLAFFLRTIWSSVCTYCAMERRDFGKVFN